MVSDGVEVGEVGGRGVHLGRVPPQAGALPAASFPREPTDAAAVH